jgi:hypothetical protein
MGTRVVRRLVAGAVAGLAAGLLTMSGAAPAAAGGPTSVVLSLPGSGRMSVLHVGSPDYEALWDAVGIHGSVPGPAGATAAEGTAERHDQGPVLRLTWLIHDVEPWRLDEVYLLAPKGPWISTRTADEAGEIWSVPQVWSRSPNPDRLRALVAKLGVDPTAIGTVAGTSDGVAPPTGAPAEPTAAGPAGSLPGAVPAGAGSSGSAASSEGSGGGRFAGWVWGVVGLVAGAALTVAGEQAWARRRGGAAGEVPPEADAGAEPEPGPPAELELDPVVVRR